MIKRSETIRELLNGWLNKHTGYTHKSAIHAHRAVMRRHRMTAGNVMTIINWEPTTEVGTIIVKAILSA